MCLGTDGYALWCVSVVVAPRTLLTWLMESGRTVLPSAERNNGSLLLCTDGLGRNLLRQVVRRACASLFRGMIWSPLCPLASAISVGPLTFMLVTASAVSLLTSVVALHTRTRSTWPSCDPVLLAFYVASNVPARLLLRRLMGPCVGGPICTLVVLPFSVANVGRLRFVRLRNMCTAATSSTTAWLEHLCLACTYLIYWFRCVWLKRLKLTRSCRAFLAALSYWMQDLRLTWHVLMAPGESFCIPGS